MSGSTGSSNNLWNRKMRNYREQLRKVNNRPDPTPILRQCDRVSLWKEAQVFSLHEGPGATPTESPRLLQPTITGQVDRSVTDRRVSEM